MPTFISGTLAILTLLGGLMAIALLAGLVFKDAPFRVKLSGQRAIAFAFFVALVATLGSLFYSDILGYTPCKLCWFQRIFMYPQVLLLGLALFRRDNRILDYTLWLSGAGGLIAAYHYAMQLGFVPGICATVGISVSCSQRFVLEYGYITIPMMALTAFALIFLTSLTAIRARR